MLLFDILHQEKEYSFLLPTKVSKNCNPALVQMVKELQPHEAYPQFHGVFSVWLFCAMALSGSSNVVKLNFFPQG
jgi:hypothetical protein